MKDRRNSQSSKPLDNKTLQVHLFFVPSLWYSTKDELETKKDELLLRTKIVDGEKYLVTYANIQRDIMNLLSVSQVRYIIER